MISIRIQKLTKRFGAVTALHDLDLSIEPGEMFFLLGPSGCGKTTLLLGLEERNLPRPEIRAKVGEALESVHMGDYAERRPNQLSGGQQQRVALARALVIRPRCLLLDEPLSNLDARLRLEMRMEIRRVCKEFKLTTVYVTHDQKEALSVSDRMAILDAGRILQVGSPQDIYRRPARRAVADFIGETNFIPGRIVSASAGKARVATSAGELEGVLGDPKAQPPAGSAVTISARPECWTISGSPSGPNAVRGRIGASVYLGENAQYDFVAGDISLKILELNPRLAERPGTGEFFASVRPEDVVVLSD
jgi:iron(III) transport system ATP-binding protein